MKKEKVKGVIKKITSSLGILFFWTKKACVSCFSFLFIFFVLRVSNLNAQVGGEGSSVDYSLNPLNGVNSFPALIELFLRELVIPLGAIVATLAIVYSGFLFVTSQGSPDKISKAKAAFFWGIVGGLILLGSLAIAEMISATIEPIT